MASNHSQYYTAQEAQAKLGLSKSLFHKQVKQGLIPKVSLSGMKRGLYPRRDIDALALSMSAATGEYLFSASTPADQVEERQIGIKCFGSDFITPLAKRISFQQKNRFTFHSFKVHRKVVGYISMFHLPDRYLDDLLTGKKIEKEIELKNVLPFTRLENFPVYIDVLVVDPDLKGHLRRLYAGMLVFHFIALILRLISNNYQITHLYTVAATKEGERLFRKIGFQLIEGKSLVSGRQAFEYTLDVQGIERLRMLASSFHRRLRLLS